MRRLILALAMTGVTVLLASGAALGITNGTPDGNTHPNVGALVDTFDGETYPYCTGTLISPTVFLTAAHCYPETNGFYVTFAEEPTSNSTRHYGKFTADNINDIAVVEFDRPVSGITPARLPTLRQFANAAKGSKFTAVGYGGQLAPKEPGGPLIVYDYKREWAVTTLKSVTPTYLRLSQNQGSGGTCYGDSGGPNFAWTQDGKSETNVIASTTITGDTWCKATNVTLRLDTRSSRAFLDDFVTLP